jgi:hypothetical protein
VRRIETGQGPNCYPLCRRACQAAALRSGAPAGSKESRGGARPRRECARAGSRNVRYASAGVRTFRVRGNARATGARRTDRRSTGARTGEQAGDAHAPTRSSPVGPLALSEGRAPDGSGDRGSGVNDVGASNTSYASSARSTGHASSARSTGHARLTGGGTRGSATAAAQCAEIRHPGTSGHHAAPSAGKSLEARTRVGRLHGRPPQFRRQGGISKRHRWLKRRPSPSRRTWTWRPRNRRRVSPRRGRHRHRQRRRRVCIER